MNSIVQQNKPVGTVERLAIPLISARSQRIKARLQRAARLSMTTKTKSVLLVAAITPTMEKVMVKAARVVINPVLSIRGRSGRQMGFIR